MTAAAAAYMTASSDAIGALSRAIADCNRSNARVLALHNERDDLLRLMRRCRQAMGEAAACGAVNAQLLACLCDEIKHAHVPADRGWE